MGFKLADVKAILLNHNHQDQSGGAFSLKEKSGARSWLDCRDPIPRARRGASGRTP
jgi:metal-dependent hydrolase (beta-lactamase superfamily II)